MKYAIAQLSRVRWGWPLACTALLCSGCVAGSPLLQRNAIPAASLTADSAAPSRSGQATVAEHAEPVNQNHAANGSLQDSDEGSGTAPAAATGVRQVSFDESAPAADVPPATYVSQPASITAANRGAPPAPPRGSFRIEQSPYAARVPCPDDPYDCLPGGALTPQYGMPVPPPGLPPVMPPQRSDRHQFADEYLRDGGDRNTHVTIGDDWSIRGLDIEDTVAHYDTLAGERKVTPSNQVKIYAPRFGSVRKSYGLIQDKSYGHYSQVGQTDLIASDTDRRGSINTHQTLAPDAQTGRKSSSIFRDRTRGLTVENPEPVAAFSNVYAAYEDFHLIRYGVLEQGEKARLAEGIQAAQTWTDELPVQAVVDNRNVIVSRGVDRAQATVGVEDKQSDPRLHIVKLASKRAGEEGEADGFSRELLSAQPGDIVHFTIRFDNVGNEKIGNVTILDNLTPRLEYVEGSAECDLEFDFFTTENEGGSLLLRWEIVEPLDVASGGVIRFKCRVR